MIIDDVYMWTHNNHIYQAIFYRLFKINVLEIWDKTDNELLIKTSCFSNDKMADIKAQLKRNIGAGFKCHI